MATTMTPVPQTVWYTFDTINGFLFQPSSGTVWHPFNPYYDPGPPPPPRPPKGFDGATPDGAMPIPFRANRYSRRNRARHPPQPGSLSPSASAFVPGARTHTPSPSPTPVASFESPSRVVPTSQTHAYTRSPAPRYPSTNQLSTAPPLMDEDMDGFPRLVHSHVPRQYQGKPKSFSGGGGGFGAHPHAGAIPGSSGRGRGRGRGRGQTMQMGYLAVTR